MVRKRPVCPHISLAGLLLDEIESHCPTTTCPRATMDSAVKIYLDTNMWDALFDGGVQPEQFVPRLAKGNRRLVLGLHAFYELAAGGSPFLNPKNLLAWPTLCGVVSRIGWAALRNALPLTRAKSASFQLSCSSSRR